jgi:hypothetical protein
MISTTEPISWVANVAAWNGDDRWVTKYGSPFREAIGLVSPSQGFRWSVSTERLQLDMTACRFEATCN